MPKKIVTYDTEDNIYSFECPHCSNIIIVHRTEINCQIFRHGVYKDTNEQINPHTTKEVCDNLVEKDLIIGCGKPFMIFIKSPESYVEECDYI
jgi:hypothetical protein